jgi:hypothetical protein
MIESVEDLHRPVDLATGNPVPGGGLGHGRRADPRNEHAF